MSKQFSVDFINKQILTNDIDTGLISDGNNTFSELYNHRDWLFISFMKRLMDTIAEKQIYKTRFDFKNQFCGDKYFIIGIDAIKGKQISYRLPMNLWDECGFAKTVDRVPAYDGHTSEDVLKRLKKYY
jgi:hypothetical protein